MNLLLAKWQYLNSNKNFLTVGNLLVAAIKLTNTLHYKGGLETHFDIFIVQQ